MALLNRDDILLADDIKSEIISVPEWGGEVKVRGAMSYERDEYENSFWVTEVDSEGNIKRKDNSSNAKARLVVACALDADDHPLFKPEEADTLGRKNGGAVNRLFQAISRLSGMTREVKENAVKNSEPGRVEGSPSSSPATSK